MSITTCLPNQQAYTIYARNKETNQTFILCYAGMPIITTDHDAVIQHAAQQVVHYGHKNIYTVARLDPLHGNVELNKALGFEN